MRRKHPCHISHQLPPAVRKGGHAEEPLRALAVEGEPVSDVERLFLRDGCGHDLQMKGKVRQSDLAGTEIDGAAVIARRRIRRHVNLDPDGMGTVRFKVQWKRE